MSRRLLLPLIALLVLAACAYESSGTSTSTTLSEEDTPPPLGPADVVVSDQRFEGSSMLIDSVTLPAPGFVVVRADAGGSPGEVIGISEALSTGTITRVPVPFFVPLAEETTVHVTLHIDVDRDGRFTYEPPDEFIDEIAEAPNGGPATTTAVLTLLAPLSPADVFVDPQITNGRTLTVASVTLPSAGWVAVQVVESGEPGEVIGITPLLDAGTVTDIEFDLDPPLESTQVVFVAVWIDRDEDGVFAPEEGDDEIGVREDGALALAEPAITVLTRSPAEVVVFDQETDGTTVTIDTVRLPSPGFVEILLDEDGEPGATLGVSSLFPPGVAPSVEVALDEPVTDDATLWVRLWIDFDQDGELSEDDVVALVERGGDEVLESFELRVS